MASKDKDGTPRTNRPTRSTILGDNKAVERIRKLYADTVAPPITSDANFQKRTLTQKEVAARNKRRGKEMERRVAKYLGGERTPMSGAGFAKGDVRVMFQNRPGHFMIECKLSAQLSERHFPVIRLQYAWLTKMHTEAIAMRSLFAALIIHYHGISDDYVLVEKNDLEKIYTPQSFPVTDWTDRHKKGMTIKVQQFRAMLDDTGMGLLKLPLGDYYVTTLENFKRIIEHA